MPYRSDREALEQRRAALQAELEQTVADVQALEGASAKKARIEQELRDVADKLAHGSTLLESVRIASPCSAAWNEMKGDDRRRFCGSCEKNVYDLSKMTRGEAEAFILSHETACVRLWRRRDGTVITSDCPVGVRRKKLRRVVAVAVGTGALAAGAMLLRWRAASCERDIVVVAGGMEPSLPQSAEPVAPPSAEPADTAPAPAPAAAPHGKATIGSISTSGGAVANARAVVAGMAAGFRRCYSRGLREDAGMKGSVRITAAIGPNGEVLSATPSGGAGLSGTVVSCIAAGVSSAQFAAPEGGRATLVIPIELGPETP
jgi:hypothetical protein